MTTTDTRSRGAGTSVGQLDSRGTAGGRRIRPHRALPGSRAVVGGFLVAVSAVGLFGAYQGANRHDRTLVALAAHDLAAGDRLSSADVRWVAMDLPGPVRQQTFHRAPDMEGRLLVGPIAAGELVQTGDLLPGGQPPDFRELTIEVDAAQLRALNEGDTVDVLVSTGSGDGTRTEVAGSGVRVVRLPRTGTVTTGIKPAVTLALPTFDATFRLVSAAHAGTITLVRSTGLPSQPATYQPSSRAAAP